MKQIFTIIGLCLCSLTMAQKKKNFNNIIKSQDIAEITEFLEVAHPDDPRRPVLKKRLVQLKNEAWTKGKETYKPMETRIVKVDTIQEKKVEVAPANTLVVDETEEYKQLMATYSAEKKDKTVGVLNSLFDNDVNAKDATLMIENKSDCNIIVRIEGKKGKKYKLPVPAKNQNSIVVEKDFYSLSSIVCGGNYASQKDIQKSLMLTLQNPNKETATANPKVEKTTKTRKKKK